MNTTTSLVLAPAQELTSAFISETQANVGSGIPTIERILQAFDGDSSRYLSAVAAYFKMKALRLEDLKDLAPALEVIPFFEANKRLCAAFRADGRCLLLVVADPLDGRTRTWIDARLRQHSGQSVIWAVATIADLRTALGNMRKTVRAMDTIGVSECSHVENHNALSISIDDISNTESHIVRLVNSTIYDALLAGASDIHLESQAHGLNVKYRLDGVLAMVKYVEGNETASQVVSRIKVISELDIAERRIPQDGRFKVLAEGREIDLRVSVMPNLFGEDAVLRILDRYHLSGNQKSLNLETLGFSAQAMNFVRELSLLPYGLLLITGPTGSGKTTTVYAAISEINTGLDKIVTIEDPVEYELANVLQIPVNEKKGLTFARGLRSILRHDPDKIMVGEIRDAETAQIAVQAALTGHQVFTTVHANNVFDVIGRFANMGVDSYSFVSAMNGILAQRLVRITCLMCGTAQVPSAAVIAKSGLTGKDLSNFSFRHGLGCSHCRGSGFKGRRAIAEMLPLNDELRDLMADKASLSKIKAAARLAGFRTLREAAMDLVASGMTTLEEINRVTPVE